MKIYILKLTNNAGVSIDYEFSNNDERRIFTVKAVSADRMATINKIEFLERMEDHNG